MSRSDLTPDDVKAMPLDKFEQRFGFRPVDALEKHFFAGMGQRLSPFMRNAIEQGLLGPLPDLSNIVME